MTLKIIKNRGFSLIELLIAIAILVSLVAIVMPNLLHYRNEQSLENTSVNIVNYLNLAKANSLSSLNGKNYGIHFESNQMVYFVGNTYQSGLTTNKIIPFSSGVILNPEGGLNLSDGGNDVIFPRLTGDVTGYGTIMIELSSHSSIQKVIKINKLGSISFE